MDYNIFRNNQCLQIDVDLNNWCAFKYCSRVTFKTYQQNMCNRPQLLYVRIKTKKVENSGINVRVLRRVAT